MRFKAVIFDLDGTLVHTAPEYRYKIVGQTLTELGATASERSIDRFWFEHCRNEIIREQFQLEPTEFWTTYQKYDNMQLRRQFTKRYEDVEIIPKLRESGYKTGIVTGAPPHIVEIELALVGRDNFDQVIISHHPTNVKEKHEMDGLKECLAKLEVNASEAAYIGNANEDVVTAKKASVLDIFIERQEYKFTGTKPTVTIKSLYELQDVLK